MKTLLVVVVVMVVVVVSGQDASVVNTADGRLAGKMDETVKGRSFYAFYGVPYARPPIGELRFKDPLPTTRWMRLWPAKEMPQPCLQLTFEEVLAGGEKHLEDILGSEDCLYLNVFTPSMKKLGGGLPVMVWFHGGGFFSGSAQEYLPHVLLDQDIVLVVVQYRLGVMGFLSTEDEVMPGNLGLKDQTLALLWVQRNIYNFGGDKSRVTIFGESAGGASVHYQMITPASKGLFHRVIMHSGNALAPWALSSSSTMKKSVEAVRRAAECPPHQDSQELLQCLQKADARTLALVFQEMFEWTIVPLALAPHIDGTFLPDHPASLVKQGQYHPVDLMAGVTAHEGAIMARSMLLSPTLMTELSRKFSTLGPVSVGMEDEEDSTSIAKHLYQHYLGDLTIDQHHIEELVQLYSDVHFNVGDDLVANHHITHSTGQHATYRYKLVYRGQCSLTADPNMEIGKHWVSHADDLFYLFAGGPLLLQPPHRPPMSQPQDLHLRDTITKMWANFAATGDPTPDGSLGFRWSAGTPDTSYHYLALQPEPRMAKESRNQTLQFFGSLSTTMSKILLTPDHNQEEKHRDEL